MARQASEKERAKDLPTYKDNDFLNDGRVISIGPEKREILMKTIQADTEVSRTTCRQLALPLLYAVIGHHHAVA